MPKSRHHRKRKPKPRRTPSNELAPLAYRLYNKLELDHFFHIYAAWNTGEGRR